MSQGELGVIEIRVFRDKADMTSRIAQCPLAPKQTLDFSVGPRRSLPPAPQPCSVRVNRTGGPAWPTPNKSMPIKATEPKR